MKLQAILFASAVALFASADLVAAEWLKVSPGESYNDYCGPDSRKSGYYMCFRSQNTIMKQYKPDEFFKGYLAPDLKGFVILYSSPSTITFERFKIWVSFQVVQPDNGIHCGSATITGPEDKKTAKVFLKAGDICQPGGKVVNIPPYLTS